MVCKAKLTIEKSKTLLLEQQILGLNWQLTKLNSKVDLISAWISKKFGVYFLDESSAAVKLKAASWHLSVHKSAGPCPHSSLNPGLKENEGSDSDDQHSDNSVEDDVIVVESDVDNYRTPLGIGEPEICPPSRRQHKRKDQQNTLARVGVKVNENRRSAEARNVLADGQSETRSNALKFSCEWPDCKYFSNQKSNLIRHQRTHSGDKPFNCTWNWKYCGRLFAEDCSLVKHRRTHTGEKPYCCDWPNCGKSFTQNSNIQRHQKTYTNERAFKCSYCYRGFGTRQVLTAHVRTHTGEKPYICETCGTGFATSSNQVRHTKCHHWQNQ